MFPDFFAEAPRLTLFDPLAQLLGAPADGRLEYGYADAVRLAGHSCPTVASAFLMTRLALRALYPEALPVRGEISVQVGEGETEGVAGVMAAVAGLLTGAAGAGGFAGLGGRHSRRRLLTFGQSLRFGQLRFSRPNGAAVEIRAQLQHLPADPRLPALLPHCLSGEADAEQQALFQQLWQQRVRRLLLDHADDLQLFPLQISRR